MARVLAQLKGSRMVQVRLPCTTLWITWRKPTMGPTINLASSTTRVCVDNISVNAFKRSFRKW